MPLACPQHACWLPLLGGSRETLEAAGRNAEGCVARAVSWPPAPFRKDGCCFYAAVYTACQLRGLQSSSFLHCHMIAPHWPHT